VSDCTCRLKSCDDDDDNDDDDDPVVVGMRSCSLFL